MWAPWEIHLATGLSMGPDAERFRKREKASCPGCELQASRKVQARNVSLSGYTSLIDMLISVSELIDDLNK